MIVLVIAHILAEAPLPLILFRNPLNGTIGNITTTQRRFSGNIVLSPTEGSVQYFGLAT
jgi:hypothetical protein